MKIFDSLSEKNRALKKRKKPVKIFVCGPTVYDFSHIGHARTYLIFDALAKYLRHRGIKIYYLQNITDIDDKIIQKAKKENSSTEKIARFFEKEYLKDMKVLGITAVDRYARAGKHIPEIQKQISKLVKKGFAYETENGVYFEIRKKKDYGKLSKQTPAELRPGYRIEPDPDKKDPLDFALWKKTAGQKPPGEKEIRNFKLKIKNSEPLWASPWGWGRPGWHIEDTAISEKYLGEQYDIHGGGNDLKFPHHEAEIAQQESASGKKPFVKIWMHTGFLMVYGEKMSKSLGNFTTIRDFLKPHGKNGAGILRWLVFSLHYRSPLNYVPQLAKQAKNSLANISEFLEKARFAAGHAKKGAVRKETAGKIKKFEAEFYDAMDNDFNTPAALAAVFNFIADFQKNIWSLSAKEAEAVSRAITTKLKIFEIKPEFGKIPSTAINLAQKREEMRAHKQFIPADRLRKKIEQLGYKVDDTPFGPFVRKEKQ